MRERERTINAYVTLHWHRDWNRNRNLPGQRSTVQYSNRRTLQYRDTDYNRYIVTMNNEMNNHKSVSMSNYKTINNQSISTTLLCYYYFRYLQQCWATREYDAYLCLVGLLIPLDLLDIWHTILLLYCKSVGPIHIVL